MPLVFPIHPRTRTRLSAAGLLDRLVSHPGIRITKPLGYLEFMALVTRASLVITDSGGVQEETTYLGIPCLTLRESTERPITVTEGSNRLIDAASLLDAVEAVFHGKIVRRDPPELWDGKTARRVAQSLRRNLAAPA
jgi:UDP-N-acetylglucosamine 2-epimerase (non-hydrolysing)